MIINAKNNNDKKKLYSFTKTHALQQEESKQQKNTTEKNENHNNYRSIFKSISKRCDLKVRAPHGLGVKVPTVICEFTLH